MGFCKPSGRQTMKSKAFTSLAGEPSPTTQTLTARSVYPGGASAFFAELWCGGLRLEGVQVGGIAKVVAVAQ